MKLMHLSDLHLGKRVNEFSMLEDQRHVLQQVIDVIDIERPTAVIIAGDVYDKPTPPAEAVELFDDFLVAISKRNVKAFIISGNHDSPERLSFGARLMDASGIYFAPVYKGNITPINLTDEFGTVSVYMLPFIKPANARRFFPDSEITSYTDAVTLALSNAQLKDSNRNILVTHQFVTGATRSESEEISVGGTDNVDASVFKGFDYVALGHIHGPQNIGSEHIRYSGTPLKYSFSEAKHTKSMTMVELGEKGRLEISLIPFKPLRDLVEITGLYADIVQKDYYEKGGFKNDYLHITLTDEEDVIDAVAKLKTVYPNLMKLDYDNTRTRKNSVIGSVKEIEQKSPLQLFSEFYALQNNQPMTDEQEAYVKTLIESVWGDEK